MLASRKSMSTNDGCYVTKGVGSSLARRASQFAGSSTNEINEASQTQKTENTGEHLQFMRRLKVIGHA